MSGSANGKVIVFGSINTDLLIGMPRLPRAGETVRADGIDYQLGGKGANQAVAAARAGACTMMVGAVGRDDQGAAMTAALAAYGVDLGGVEPVAGSTGTAVVATSPQDNQIIVIAGANARVDKACADRAIISAGDICLAQLEVPAAATQRFFERARAVGARTLLNAAPFESGAARTLVPLLDMLIVNESECCDLAGTPGADLTRDAVLLAAAGQSGIANGQVMILTLGASGVAIVADGSVRRIAGEKVAVVDTTGAGDCFCGYLAAGLAQAMPLELAARRANIAASIAVQARGAAAAMPSAAQVAMMQGAGGRPDG